VGYKSLFGQPLRHKSAFNVVGKPSALPPDDDPKLAIILDNVFLTTKTNKRGTGSVGLCGSVSVGWVVALLRARLPDLLRFSVVYVGFAFNGWLVVQN
jgi:hypothetical protein